jgi:hypothetical protein
MDELIKEIMQRTGISEQQARGAADVALDFLEKKLPAPIAAQVRNFINSDQADGVVKQGMDMLDNIGGMFGKK